jgi:hypothetical protein
MQVLEKLRSNYQSSTLKILCFYHICNQHDRLNARCESFGFNLNLRRLNAEKRS